MSPMVGYCAVWASVGIWLSTVWWWSYGSAAGALLCLGMSLGMAALAVAYRRLGNGM